MLFISRGYGILVPVIGAGCLAAAQVVTDVGFGIDTYASHVGPLAGIALTVAAGINFWFSLWLEAKEKVPIHAPIPKRRRLLRPGSTFFFIPVPYWTYIFLASALLCTFFLH